MSLKFTGFGRLTKDPVVRETTNSKVCTFDIADNKRVAGKEETFFFRCKAWGKQAEIIGEYLKKGSRIFISGDLEEEKWNDKEGNKRSTVTLNVRDFDFLDGKKEAVEQTQAEPEVGVPEAVVVEEEVPF
jgi:single-strand DNA-binding protein